MPDNKQEAFERLAEKRVNEAVKKLRLIGNLANRRNYSYTSQHVKEIFDALEEEVRVQKGRFQEESEQKSEFRFRKVGRKAAG